MRGPFILRPLQVDMHIPVRVGGVYCLGNDPRSVAVVGRVDRDLREQVKSFWERYQFFWYEPALTARECYERHCQAFHKHTDNGLESKEHPALTDGQAFRCPICGR